MQDKFWPFHDALFSGDLGQSEEKVMQIVAELGLDAGRFAADRLSVLAEERVRGDVEAGLLAEVNATPGIFLNGRKVTDLSPSGLRALIDHELEGPHE